MSETFTWSIELPTDVAQRIADAVCVKHGYNAEGGVSQFEFTQQVTMRWLVEQTLNYEATEAATAARDAVLTNPDDPLVGVLAQG